jgi:hypothetical protein
MMIRCGKLTTCKALSDGETLMLDLIDADGKPVSVLLSFEHAESIAMTLPRLLTQAVKTQTGQDNARYVFPLGPWRLERIEDSHSFILTLATTDGFEVSFRIPHEACRTLGWTLKHEAEEAIAVDDSANMRARTGTTEIN